MPNPLGKSFIRGLRSPSAPSGYPSNWKEISAAYRKKCGYKCADCSVDCSAHHHHLTDAHHINGDKSDCCDDNLQCLCKLCHAKKPGQPYHIKEEHKQKLRQLQQEQNIPLRG